ncbi:hypothetical protein QR680_001433 [Steinernema hermaphroditum]|uniref:Reverse transcriptase domain-containing protein n=1 Tax=Steinernema hermaphroditum TaxID=289476 RepID=A0AA39GY97_9BILA|nr:hypothetical protein QR680_001433 [Steinernema hermaphroditum]
MLFTKLFRPLLEHWRKDGITCALYLDDGLIFAPTYELCKRFVTRVRDDLAKAGVIVSEDKCRWDPVQRLNWLGYDIDLEDFGVRIAAKRVDRIVAKIDHSLSASPSKRERMQLAGSLASIGYVFGPAAQLKARIIHAELNSMMALPQSARQVLSVGERGDLIWWKRNIRHRNWRPLHKILNARRIATDASATGAGVVIWNRDGSTSRTAINFTPHERAESSTSREVLAVEFGLRVFSSELAGSQVIVEIDNVGAVSIIQKGSPKPGLQSAASAIFELAETIGAEIVPVWVPRDQNMLADEASRLIDRDDWGISPDFFQICCQRWGTPSIDVFANNIGSEGVNAFASSWATEFVWAVPPPNLIPLTVAHLLSCKGRAILGVPWWPSHMFFPSLWVGLSWAWFVKDFICVEKGSVLFTPSTYEQSVFNESVTSFDFYFLLIDPAL